MWWSGGANHLTTKNSRCVTLIRGFQRETTNAQRTEHDTSSSSPNPPKLTKSPQTY
jgi:hypothetical protein